MIYGLSTCEVQCSSLFVFLRFRAFGSIHFISCVSPLASSHTHTYVIHTLAPRSHNTHTHASSAWSSYRHHHHHHQSSRCCVCVSYTSLVLSGLRAAALLLLSLEQRRAQVVYVLFYCNKNIILYEQLKWRGNNELEISRRTRNSDQINNVSRATNVRWPTRKPRAAFLFPLWKQLLSCLGCYSTPATTTTAAATRKKSQHQEKNRVASFFCVSGYHEGLIGAVREKKKKL